MTLWSRAIFGALIGAILTLFVHPSSRPYLSGPFIESSNLIQGPQYAPLPKSFPETLPEPSDDLSASLWIHVGAEQIKNRVELSNAQIEGLIKIARTRGKKDVANAFWKIAEAAYCGKLGRKEEARQAWMVASRCIGYDDYQTRYLLQVRETLAKTTASNSWQFAYCYRLRSFAFAIMVESFARNLVGHLSRKTPDDLALRYATLVNGGLLRDGARNLEIMQRGIAIVELASHPPELQTQASIKRLLIAHSDFKEALKSIGMVEEAQRVEGNYNQNDGWYALTKREDTGEKLASLTLFSALWPNLPGVLLQCSIVFGAIWLLGLGMERLVRIQYRYAVIAALALAVTLSVSVFLLTDSNLALLATALCCLFILLSPRNVRTQLPKELGPLFTCAVLTLATAFLGLTAIMFMTRTLPVVANAPAFDSQLSSIIDFRLAAGLALILISCLYLFAPLWAMAQHIRTMFVLARGLRTFGAIGTILGLVLSVAATPICVYFEKENQETFGMLLKNEPVYYYRQ
jgi:hypothetical protein